MSRLSQVFVPKDREFFDLFEEAATNVVRGADLLDQMLRNYPESKDLARDIGVCEQEGDRITHDIIQRLNNTFVTPIDREDIITLASALDDIADFTEEVADYLGSTRSRRRWSRPAPGPHPAAGRPAGRRGHAADARLPRHQPLHGRDQPPRERRDRIVREAIASLFEGGIDPMIVIRWKDLFERLEEAIDACESVAHVLEGIVIKNA